MSNLKSAVTHPWTSIRKVKSNILKIFVSPPDKQVNILKEDWDNLIILDACRYDTFAEYYDGNVERIYSNASHTAEFLERNAQADYSDIVYITGSPQVAGYEDHFFKVRHLWDECWDESLETVPPWNMTEKAAKIAASYPKKRIIVHYMQPHYPFIGRKGKELGSHATFTGGKTERNKPSVWDLLTAKKVSKRAVKEAYEENLEIALPYVTKLTASLDGKTVISSDHGNLFGKKVCRIPIQIEGHPINFHHPDLLAVPWVELEYDSRKDTVMEDDDQNNTRTQTTSNVKQRLKDLGYKS